MATPTKTPELEMGFLPDDYKVPEANGSYMKLKPGKNVVRVIGRPALGTMYWKTFKKDDGSDGRKPVRVPRGVGINLGELEGDERPKHFWAMPVWNYADSEVQILEITQKGIQQAIFELSHNADWGSPVNYDIVITRQGEGKETSYILTPVPPKALAPEIKDVVDATEINMDAIFSGGDPLSAEPIIEEAGRVPDEINLDEINL